MASTGIPLDSAAIISTSLEGILYGECRDAQSFHAHQAKILQAFQFSCLCALC
jgi:hypothetical protein